ncbi:MAG: 30S ribosomal protein S6, partial [Lachnospiraceae bacterium]|nr:30S ribosomal protein S6 [Lachnospiraceae bacterium]
MNKYELALVVSTKIDDEARAEVVEKAKAIVEKAGGTITEVEEWGKK